MLARTLLLALLLTPAGFYAQDLPLALDPGWSEVGEGLTLQVAGNTPHYSLGIEECPDLEAQCIALLSDGAVVYLTYTLDATELRGKRVRFSASLLAEYPAISRVRLFMRVDRVAGVGFHEYTDGKRNASPAWATPQLVGTVAEDAKHVTVGMRFTGRGLAYLAEPKLEAAGE